MKTLGNLSPAKGSNVKKKRLGRGIGGGFGETAGKGVKGQKARKSSDVAPGFEGGQMPLYRRLPKRGFKPLSRIEYNVVNLDRLNVFESGASVDAAALERAGLLRSPHRPIKLLGRGKLEKPLNISVHKVSESARAAVEKAGGKIEEI